MKELVGTTSMTKIRGKEMKTIVSAKKITKRIKDKPKIFYSYVRKEDGETTGKF